MGPAKVRTVDFSGGTTDFPEWRMEFTALMETLDLCEILTGEKKCPARQHGGDTVAAWTKKNRRIYSQLVLALDQTTLRRIASYPDDGQKAWSVINEHYHGTDKLRANNLKSDLLSLSCVTDDAVNELILSVKDLCSQLRAAGEELKDDDEVDYILRALPSSYETFVAMSALMQQQNRTTEIFEQQLQAFTKNRMHMTQRDARQPGSAMMAKHGRNRHVQNRSDRECFNCGKKGHLKSECWAKGGDQYGQQPQRKRGDRRNKHNGESASTAIQLTVMAKTGDSLCFRKLVPTA
jgi:adenosyl cobinamide kinase/adenosyl cobinamide phosphate guanylyltransferase